ncbi:MAG TPA: hypothetical protein VI997_02205 [Candidatus Thermoplasmatota archaeon]|nr:hypothetical protein [Candidatus Thermoplasmatota archaeon]
MPRTSTTAKASDADAAIRQAAQASTFEPAPSSRKKRKSKKGRSEPRAESDAEGINEELTEGFRDVFARDARSDGSPVAPEDVARRLFDEAKDAGLIPDATKYRIDKTGAVVAINAKGHPVKGGVLRSAARDPDTGRFLSIEALGAPGTVERNALPRVARYAKSLWAQDSAGATEKRVRNVWEGYKRAHPEARGTLYFEGDTIVIREGGEVIASTRRSHPRNWRTPEQTTLDTIRNEAGDKPRKPEK